MTDTKVDLSRFSNKGNPYYDVGRPQWVQALWFFVGSPLVRWSMVPFSSFRRLILSAFGAQIAAGAVIKPGVQVKFPWKLRVGKNCWIGENCWLDNIAFVTLGDNVCLSQDVYLCTGNHDWSDPAFAFLSAPITIQDGAWVAARASLGPGVVVGEAAVVGFGSVITSGVPAGTIFSGNPARFVKPRRMKSQDEDARSAAVERRV
jgi:putative colanic acid biosynthesis acetyltransferase WcaF